MTKIICIVGTRPEAIKMAPVILALKAAKFADIKVLATAQHRQMLDQVLGFFNIKPDIDLNIMQPNQSLSTLTARLLMDSEQVLKQEQPDAVLVQGDTTTVMTLALACFYQKIAIGHVEAGLRTGDLFYPFPEEANRVLTARLSRWHFAPTNSARHHLLKEGINDSNITVTGNTVIDALLMTASKELALPKEIEGLAPDKKLVLITAHRRENFGEPFTQILSAITTLAQQHSDTHFLYPVHPNPNVKDRAYQALAHYTNISLCPPLEYAPFVAAMKRATIILSDSGGVQEEAPALGKPVLVLRDETERPEAVEQGVVELVGPNHDKIVQSAHRLLTDARAYQAMAQGISPYGDGQAAERIVHVLKSEL